MKAGSLFDGEETNVRLGMALSKVDSERFPFIQCVTDSEGFFEALFRNFLASPRRLLAATDA